MKYENICTMETKMVVLNVRLDNFYAFKNFELNLSYPKKIVNSTIENEYLYPFKNFRYKKVNIIFGSNATGKTTLGKVIMAIFNFIRHKNYAILANAISDTRKNASFVIDMASQTGYLYRVACVIPPFENDLAAENIQVDVRKVKIYSRDSYESCVKRISDKPFSPAKFYIKELEKIEPIAWLFEYPEWKNDLLVLPNKDEIFKFVLENILKSLDPNITNVNISQDAERAYVIHLQEKSIVVQNGQALDNDLLSSGTKAGVKLAVLVTAIMKHISNFYYCDENFSYIHTDIEKTLLSLMIDFLGPCDQLFFTTHNTDILDMDLPKHSYVFLRKDVNNDNCPITCMSASSLLKRQDDSLRNAVENDLFSTAPALELIYDIQEYGKDLAERVKNKL